MGGNEEVINVVEEVVIMVFEEEGPEHFLHCLTEGGGGVCEAKIHDGWFIESERGLKCCLPPIFLLDADIVVSPVYIKFGEEGFSLEVVQDVANER